MIKQIYVNLPIANLEKSMEFFKHLGFTIHPQFTNDVACAVVLGENIYAMLLLKSFFKSFIPNKQLSDTSKTTEVLIAIDATSRTAVDIMMKKVIEAGGTEFREASDHGWMYSRTFEDLDGHLWEIMYMDISKMPKQKED